LPDKPPIVFSAATSPLLEAPVLPWILAGLSSRLLARRPAVTAGSLNFRLRLHRDLAIKADERKFSCPPRRSRLICPSCPNWVCLRAAGTRRGGKTALAHAASGFFND
jgi:hypothetical protein